MPTAELTRIDGVELARVGRWSTLTGVWDAKGGDFAAAVEAATCTATRAPIIKLGHLDPRFTPHAEMPTFDGTPSIGWIENMRAEGDVLLGDLVGIPQWLRTVAASAFPNRSIEGAYNRRCAAGHLHPFSIGAVSLLGVTPPGVDSLRSLNDIPALFGIAAEGCADADAGEVVVATVTSPVVAADGEHTGAMVALLPSVEDAERLAVEGGEQPEQLHVTLAYLGKGDDLDAAMRQDVIDSVSTAVNGMPVVEADGFALSVFNPGNANDRDPCITLGLSGDLLDAVHAMVAESVLYASPRQHAPWCAHLTLVYTGDLSRLAGLVDRIGPVRFDRVRIAFAGHNVDIPLIGDDDTDPAGAEPDDLTDADYIAAAKGDGGADRYKLRRYFTEDPRGLKRWRGKKHPWTALFRILREHMDPERAKRVTSAWYKRVFGHMPNQKVAATSGGVMPDPDPTLDPRPPAGPVPPAGPPPEPDPTEVETTAPPHPGGVPVSPDPGAEPEANNETEGDGPVSTLSADVRTRLGLADDADDAAVVAALDALKTQAETPPAPTPEQVAASAATAQENAELRKEVSVLASQMQHVTTELAAAKAKEAAIVKAAVLDDAAKLGKFAPADRDRWAEDYDSAPAVVARVLASIAPGTAVPVAAAGHTGTGEEVTDVDALSNAEAGSWAAMLGIDAEELTR